MHSTGSNFSVSLFKRQQRCHAASHVGFIDCRMHCLDICKPVAFSGILFASGFPRLFGKGAFEDELSYDEGAQGAAILYRAELSSFVFAGTSFLLYRISMDYSLYERHHGKLLYGLS